MGKDALQEEIVLLENAEDCLAELAGRKMKTKITTKTAMIFLALLILIPSISAISITIDMKPSFNIGEQISFDYTIISSVNEQIEYLVSVDCPNAPIPLLEIKNANLTANVPLAENYVYMSTLNDNIEPQDCSAVVGILSPEEISETKNFSIVTNPGFEINILTCKDVNCNEKTKVFVKNEDIYLDYNSNIDRISVTGILTFPNKNKQQLTIPGSIKAEQIGTYNLEINASKLGYKTITRKVQFGVIEREIDIGYTSLSQIKSINEQIKKTELSYIMLLVIIGSIMLLAAAVLFIIFLRNREEQKKKIKKKEFLNEVLR